MATWLSLQPYRFRSSLSSNSIHQNRGMNLLARRIPMRVAALLVVLPDIVLALSSSSSTNSATARSIRQFTSSTTDTIPSRSDRDAATLAFSTAKLQTIASECAVKVPGSLGYLRTWRRWSETAIDLIRDDLRNHNLPAKVDQQALSDLSYNLGQAADDGAMPSFQDEGARAGYAVDYFCRAQLLADLLFESRSGVGTGLEPAFWVDSVQKNILLGLGNGSSTSPTSSSSYRLCSLGGGPGFDFVGLALISSFHKQQQHQQQKQEHSSPSVAIPITATILDYEHGWSPFVQAMSTSVDSVLGGSHSCDFDGCDITVPLSDPANARCAQEVLDTDLWVCSYCVSENAVKLRQGNPPFVFFRDIFAQAKENSIFVFTETTHRLWPELVDVALETAGFDVAFPRRNGRGKSGRQLILRKRAGATTLSAEAMEQRGAFERDSTAHKRKIEVGFRRERRKIPGAK
jgi:hypothetical protein